MSSGDAAERALSDWLEDELNMAAMRSPGSGGRTERERPDVLAGKGGCSWAAEVKKSPDGTVTFKEHEIPDLLDFAERFGAHPIVVVKPDLRSHGQWYCFDAWAVHETENGHSVRKQDHERAMTRREVFAE